MGWAARLNQRNRVKEPSTFTYRIRTIPWVAYNADMLRFIDGDWPHLSASQPIVNPEPEEKAEDVNFEE